MSMLNRPNPGESPFSTDFSGTSTSEEPFFVEIDESPVTPPVEVEEPPAWFRGPASPQQKPQPPKPSPPPPPKPGKSPKTTQGPNLQKRPAPLVAPTENLQEELSWREKAQRWIVGEGGAGFGVSVVLHVILLLIMSLFVLTRPEENVNLITTLEETDIVDMASIQDVEIEALESDFEPQTNNPLFEPAPLSAPNIGVGLPASASESIGGGLTVKIPSQAVTRGSFTVWTEPEDPKPGEKYKIWIQVRLNNEVKRYPRRDLTGSIVGTDGYKDYFGGPTEVGYLPIHENTVRYDALTVPGAAQLVKDIIKVESKILKEKQTIELVF